MNLTFKDYKEHLQKIIWLFGKSKKYLFLLIFCFVISGFMDIVGISLIAPYIAMLIDYEKTQEALPFLYSFTYQEVAIYSSIFLILVFLFRIIVAYIVNNFVLRISFERQIELRSWLISTILSKSYAERLNKSSGYYSSAIISYCSEFTNTVISVLRGSAEIISILFITLLLVITDWKLFLLTLALAGTILLVAVTFFSRKFALYGEIKNEGRRRFTDAVNDSVNGLKEIKVLKIADYFIESVVQGAQVTAQAERKLYLYTIVPRYFIECVLVIIICSILLFSLLINGSVIDTLPTLSIFLVASIRLLPSLNAVFQNFNIINLEIDSVRKLYQELQYDPSEKSISVDYKDVEFSYDKFTDLNIKDLSFSFGEKRIFDKASVTINKGDFVGVLGKSGEGKTTFVDLILGIYRPESGSITANGNSIYSNIDAWRENLAYLPQETFLINASIAENIAIGEEINYDIEQKINSAIVKSGLSSVIESMKDGIHTQIGEKGLMLSGGQRQRISLARAFYKNKNIFIFDESTSALDAESAERILEHIYQMSKEGSTIFIISHNDYAVKKCSRKLIIKEQKISEFSD